MYHTFVTRFEGQQFRVNIALFEDARELSRPGEISSIAQGYLHNKAQEMLANLSAHAKSPITNRVIVDLDLHNKGGTVTGLTQRPIDATAIKTSEYMSFIFNKSSPTFVDVGLSMYGDLTRGVSKGVIPAEFRRSQPVIPRLNLPVPNFSMGQGAPPPFIGSPSSLSPRPTSLNRFTPPSSARAMSLGLDTFRPQIEVLPSSRSGSLVSLNIESVHSVRVKSALEFEHNKFSHRFTYEELVGNVKRRGLLFPRPNLEHKETLDLYSFVMGVFEKVSNNSTIEGSELDFYNWLKVEIVKDGRSVKKELKKFLPFASKEELKKLATKIRSR